MRGHAFALSGEALTPSLQLRPFGLPLTPPWENRALFFLMCLCLPSLSSEQQAPVLGW